MLAHSFNALSVDQKKRFDRMPDRYLAGSPGSLELKRSLWDVENSKKGLKRVKIRFDVIGGFSTPKIFAKSGLTPGPYSGIVLGYGWNRDVRSGAFERNLVSELNRATDGVKIYYSTPGEKLAVSELGSMSDLERYVGV